MNLRIDIDVEIFDQVSLTLGSLIPPCGEKLQVIQSLVKTNWRDSINTHLMLEKYNTDLFPKKKINTDLVYVWFHF